MKNGRSFCHVSMSRLRAFALHSRHSVTLKVLLLLGSVSFSDSSFRFGFVVPQHSQNCMLREIAFWCADGPIGYGLNADETATDEPS
jgi:hypothetical protein